jgi:glycyl-tRNA synthetase beta chain
MRHHQKYFSVEDAEGRLAPFFIAVMNTDADPEGLVRQGNERVLQARFTDARFFWEVDQQKKLEDRFPCSPRSLTRPSWARYLDKAHRMVRLGRRLARMLKADPRPVERAALLAKCDLTTEMVKEFTELQGIMGGLYARRQGEPEEVWRAIYEHYRPESMEDAIPATSRDAWFRWRTSWTHCKDASGVGLIPSGSRDPFALRRAAQGVVRILVEARLPLPLRRLLGKDQALIEFFEDRLRYYFREVRGFAYDEVNAVLAAGWDDLTDLESRLEALRRVRPTENFEPLAVSFKRIKNILRQANWPATPDSACQVREEKLEAGPESGAVGRVSARAARSAAAPPKEGVPRGPGSDRLAAPGGRPVFRQGPRQCAGSRDPAKPAELTQPPVERVLIHCRFFGNCNQTRGEITLCPSTYTHSAAAQPTATEP